MSTSPVPAKWTAEHLLTAVQQLPPPERRKFMRQLGEWQARGEERDPIGKDEALLLTAIEENSRLPEGEQRRFDHLRDQCARSRLTEGEHAEYLSLLQHLEARNVKRVEALVALAQQRGTTLRGVMQELGLEANLDAL